MSRVGQFNRLPAILPVVCGAMILLLSHLELAAFAPSQITKTTADFVLINEVDPQTPGIDQDEFIELYDGGVGQTNLDGLAVILYSGHNDAVYASYDLDGKQTDEHGYFLLASAAVSGVDMVMDDSRLQDGPDAVALYHADAAAFPVGTAVTTQNLLDALVYGSPPADAALLPLLLDGEAQIDEDIDDLEDHHSMQRCPNGAGGQRRTGAYRLDWPTPKAGNNCPTDEAPQIVETVPAAEASHVPINSALTITFSEAVNVDGEWFAIVCTQSGDHGAASSGTDTIFTLQPAKPFVYGESCQATIFAGQVSDRDAIDPPDHPPADYTWFFNITAADHIVINEIDADTPGSDTAEFIELYDGGVGGTPLDGLTVVLYNGGTDNAYRTMGLDGLQTDNQGRFLIGNSGITGVGLSLPDGTLQNGPDAVALYHADAEAIPPGSPIVLDDLLDAIVYGTTDEPDQELLSLLIDGGQIDEDGRDNVAYDSCQRCPDGAGGQRRSDSFVANTTTPGKANKCSFDAAPAVLSTTPAQDQGSVAVDATILIKFSEAVTLEEGWFTFFCNKSGSPAVDIRHTADQVNIDPQEDLAHDDLCTLTIRGRSVHDSDQDDPPDTLAEDFVLRFRTAAIQAATHIVINEVDADTPGYDTAEFIELFDGGDGYTKLDGLELLLINGADDQAYRSLDLTGKQTSAEGYFVLGGSAVDNVDLVLANGLIQNGPDAVALYESSEMQQGAPGISGLLDALVYHTNDGEDTGLSYLLLMGEPQVNEGQWRDPTLDSNQRCPNGLGGQRRTAGYVQNSPTPSFTNNCLVDTPPVILSVFPEDGAVDVPIDSVLTVRFDQPVETGKSWITLTCEQRGKIELAITGGPLEFAIQPVDLPPLDRCTASVAGDLVHDLDGASDTLASDYSWQFSTARPTGELTAAFSSSSPAIIGTSVDFINLSRGPGPLTYTWDFGDGTAAVNDINPRHNYATIGSYHVALTAKTDWGESAVASATVEILPAHIYTPIHIIP